MSTIELGEISSAPDAEPSAEFDLRLLRELALAFALLLCLIGATGSARPAPPGVRPLWSVPATDADGTTLGPDTLYLHHGPALTAYDLATGAIRWQTTIADIVGYAQLAGGLLLLPADPQTGHLGDVYTQFSRSTVALAADTGARLWSAPGEPMIVAGGTVLMADYTDTASYARLRLIRLDDQRTVWQRDTPGVLSLSFAMAGGTPTEVITVTDAGQAEVLRFADGSVTASARIDWARQAPDQGQFNDVAASGDHLMVNRNEQGHAELTVYRLDTLAPLWRTDGTDGFAFPCGSGICFSNGLGLTSYDPDTGRVRWRVPGAGSGWSATAGRVVVDKPGEVGEQYLIDAETGARVGVDSPGETVWTTEPDEALLVLEPTVSTPQRTSITRWDLATGQRDLLGAIDRIVVNRCQAVARYLGCYQNAAYTITAVG
ncbi:PQQ-like beta-propeller repeat protein [Actinoplanes sp. KI2]|uniref:PQQ-like beta-propeller repeat protein n=1 Tax=Actinoplanes sp. KI2 TaxID=2983315 RepID=UPI0021D58893|nr:PQQ-like beta-propeller repeat protein [Actinoplanes sp. KI2]MCU7724603.1 PQQ-like beta-propeller repeat protein [Actinoplanes sp. KI2]